MKAYFFVTMILLGFTNCLQAQGENNIWTFGNHYSLDFNHNPPLLRDDQYLNGTLYANTSQTVMPNIEHFYDYAQAVCDADGNLLFMVKKHVYRNTGFGFGTPAPNIFDRDEIPIASTEFLAGSDMEKDRAVIIPHPGNPDQYYIFYVRNSGLLYCLFDMSLNGGRGDIVPGQKNILLYGYNSIAGSRIAAVQGCDGIWLIARHKINKEYLSFRVSAAGIESTPVISDAGPYPSEAYLGQGILTASPDGKTIATGSGRRDNYPGAGGIELYDFEKCSGKLKSRRVLDSDHNIYGICFSPDNTKIYAGYTEPVPGNSDWIDQWVYQFDLNASNMAAIQASKTLILTNPPAQRLAPFCPTETNLMGNMQIGPDGKIYLSNSHPAVCPGTGMGMALHIIHNPNNAGIACSPQTNALWNQFNGMQNSVASSDMPYQLVLPPSVLTDTIISTPQQFSVCFKNDTVLKVPAGVSCPEWDNGSTDTQRMINHNGNYWLRYYKDCKVYVDTYKIAFTPLPDINPLQYGCQGYITLTAGAIDGVAFDMELYNDAGGKIYGGPGQSRHQVYNLEEGIYRLEIATGTGCDTILTVELQAYPAAEISIDPPMAEIKYGEELHLTATGGNNYVWTPAGSLSARTEHIVVAKPEQETRYTVTGINEYGCRDTAYAEVKVNYSKSITMPNAFSPNGDGLNDLFRIPGADYAIRKFEIYNRYGQVVYSYNGNNVGWDGSYLGKACDIGVYHYFIQLDFPDRTHITLKGDVALIR